MAPPLARFLLFWLAMKSHWKHAIAASVCIILGACEGEDTLVDGDELLGAEQDATVTQTLKIDFGPTSAATPAGWNNAHGLVKSGSLALKDAAGAATSVSLVLTAPWNATFTVGTTTAATGFAFPVDATRDGVWGSTGSVGGFAAPRAIMELRGLDASSSYGVQFFGSVKKGDTLNRDVVYRAVGGTSVQGHLDITNNDSLAVALTLKPSSTGVIRLEIEKGAANDTDAGYYDLNNVVVTRLASAPVPYGVQTAVKITNTTRFGVAPPQGYYEYLPSQYAVDTTNKWPVIIALHGIGEVGNGDTDLYKLVRSGVGLAAIIQGGSFVAHDKFIVLSPQTQGYQTPAKTRAFLNWAKAHYRIDTHHMYLMGLSYGGRATWDYLNDYGSTVEFAAALTTPGDGAYDTLNCANAGRTPMWAFHGALDADIYTSPAHIVNALNKINACSTAPVERMKLTMYTGLGHYVWNPTYTLSGRDKTRYPVDSRYNAFDEDIYAWMLRHSK